MNITPTLKEVENIAAKGLYQILPVSCEILSDFTTPLETMKILKQVSTHCYLLESAVPQGQWGRYSFLGYDPKLEITCRNGNMKIGDLKLKTSHPSNYIRQIMAERKSPGFSHLPPFTGGLVGYFSYDYFCQDGYGQIAPVYSISAGLDYPGIGPEHAHLYDVGRAQYVPVTDEEAVCAFEYLAKTEGIIPAIESAHAVAHAIKLAPTMKKDQILVITISGRGDKDCAAIARYRGEELGIPFSDPTSKERIAMIAKEAQGFLYIVSSLGVTGTRKEIKTDLTPILKEVRKNTKIPCAVGFGISTPEQARQMSAFSDGVIVGSAIIKLLAQYGKKAPSYIGAYVKSMKDAINCN